MATLDTLTVGLRGSYGRLARDLNKAQGLVKGFAARAGGLLGKGLALGVATTGIGGLLGGAGLGAAINAQLGEIDAGSKLADRLGLSTEALAGLQHAAGLAGASNEQLEKGLEGMLRRLGQAATQGGPAADALAELGLEANSLARARPEEAFGRIADAIAGIEDPARRAFYAQQLLGRGGQDLQTLMLAGSKGIAAAAAEADALGLSFDRVSGAKVEAANDAVSRMRATVTGIARAITVAVAPAIVSAADGFRDFGVRAVAWVKATIPAILQAVAAVAAKLRPILTAAAGYAMKAARVAGSAVAAVAGVVASAWSRVGPAITNLMRRLQAAGQATAAALTSAWSRFGPVLARVGAGVAAALAAIGGAKILVAVAAGVGTAVAAAAGTVALLGSALVAAAAAAAPVVAAGAAVAAAVGGIVVAAGGLGPVLSGLQAAWQATYGAISSALSGIASAVRVRAGELLAAATQWGVAIFGAISAVASAVWSVISTAAGAVATAWGAAMKLFGLEAATAATTTRGAFGGILDAVTWVADKATLGLNVLAWSLANLGDLAAYAGLAVAHQLVKIGNVAKHYLGAAIQYAKWFGENFTALIGDAAELAWTRTKNGVTNIASIIRNLPGLIAGTTNLADIWTPLNEGFEASVSALPQIAARVPGELESTLGQARDQLGQELSQGLGQYLGDQEAKAAAVAGGIQSALGKVAGGLDLPEVKEELPEAKEKAKLDAPEIETPAAPDLPAPPTLKIKTEVEPPRLQAINSAAEQAMRFGNRYGVAGKASPVGLPTPSSPSAPRPAAMRTPPAARADGKELAGLLAEAKKQTTHLATLARREGQPLTVAAI